MPVPRIQPNVQQYSGFQNADRQSQQAGKYSQKQTEEANGIVLGKTSKSEVQGKVEIKYKSTLVKTLSTAYKQG